jgi:hypothetical protein
MIKTKKLLGMIIWLVIIIELFVGNIVYAAQPMVTASEMQALFNDQQTNTAARIGFKAENKRLALVTMMLKNFESWLRQGAIINR